MSEPEANTATTNKGVGSRLSGAGELEVVHWTELFSSDPQYIDNRIQAVGWGLQLGAGCVLFVGLDRQVFLPAEHINWTMTSATPDISALYASREDALAAIASKPGAWFAYYRAVGGLIAPTVFAPVSTPRILTTLLDARKRLAEEGKEAFTALAFSIVTGQVVRLGFHVLERVKAWSPKGADWLTRKTAPPQRDAPRATGGGKPDPAAKATTRPGVGSRLVGGAPEHATGAPPVASGGAGAAPSPTAASKTRSGKLVPLPRETPEEYYFRQYGQSIADLPPAVQNASRMSTLTEMQWARIEVALENPAAIWTHYLTKSGYQSIMRSQTLRGGPGTSFGQGDAVRANQGPFKAGDPIKSGRLHLDFQVPPSPVKGEPTHYMGSVGAIWRPPDLLHIKITRVGYVDGSLARPLPSGKWQLTTPTGKKYELNQDTLLQLGERPSHGLRATGK